MVYIYRKIVGEKVYYYLRVSERKNQKIVVKDIAYLGSSLDEVKKALDNLPKYKEQIRKAYKTIKNFLEANHYGEKATKLKLKKDSFLEDQGVEIEACKLHYTTAFEHQPEITKREILKNFIIEFAFNTTAIEGNTIKLNEVRSLLQDGLTPKNKTLREIYDLQNTERVFLSLLQTKEEITHDFIIQVHRQLMENIDSRIGYRITDVRIIKANFKATPAPYVKTDMDLLLKWFKDNKKKYHPFVLAIVFHHKFEKIHPFMDGNGRTGRMLLNYILLKENYPPLVIRTKKRIEYLQALREADRSNPLEAKENEYKKLISYSVTEMTENYWNIFL